MNEETLNLICERLSLQPNKIHALRDILIYGKKSYPTEIKYSVAKNTIHRDITKVTDLFQFIKRGAASLNHVEYNTKYEG